MVIQATMVRYVGNSGKLVGMVTQVTVVRVVRQVTVVSVVIMYYR